MLTYELSLMLEETLDIIACMYVTMPVRTTVVVYMHVVVMCMYGIYGT